MQVNSDVEYRIAKASGAFFESSWPERGGGVLSGSKTRKRVYLETIGTEVRREREKMYKHRLVFCGVWLLGVVALVICPGFEAKGLIWGLRIGWWPFMLFGEWGDALTLLGIFVVSAIEVGFCAWIMDKCKVTKKVWAVLLFSITIGVVVTYCSSVDYFEAWKLGKISLIMPEGYELTMSDFHKLYLLPKTIVGGMSGFYLATAVGFIYAMGMLLYKKLRLTSRMQASANSRA